MHPLHTPPPRTSSTHHLPYSLLPTNIFMSTLPILLLTFFATIPYIISVCFTWPTPHHLPLSPITNTTRNRNLLVWTERDLNWRWVLQPSVIPRLWILFCGFARMKLTILLKIRMKHRSRQLPHNLLRQSFKSLLQCLSSFHICVDEEGAELWKRFEEWIDCVGEVGEELEIFHQLGEVWWVWMGSHSFNMLLLHILPVPSNGHNISRPSRQSFLRTGTKILILTGCCEEEGAGDCWIRCRKLPVLTSALSFSLPHEVRFTHRFCHCAKCNGKPTFLEISLEVQAW